MSSSPISILCLTSPVEISENDSMQSFHASLSHNMSKKVSIQRHDLFHHNCNEDFILIDQVKTPNFPLCNVCKHHGYGVLDSMHKEGYDYSLGMMTAFFRVMATQCVSWQNVKLQDKTGKGRKWRLQSRYSRWPAFTGCGWNLVHDGRASVDFRPPPHADHHASRPNL